MPDPRETTTNLTPEQLARLPKNVQREIERLVANIDYYKAKAEVGPEDSDTFADAFARGEGKPLGRGTRVLFHTGPGERTGVYVRVRDGAVEVASTDGPLSVSPVASNVITVRAEGYR